MIAECRGATCGAREHKAKSKAKNEHSERETWFAGSHLGLGAGFWDCQNLSTFWHLFVQGEEEKDVTPAVARAVRAGRCWLRARCRCRVVGALPLLC
jgi:hypothetical protein